MAMLTHRIPITMFRAIAATALAAVGGSSAPLAAQDARDEQFYYPGSFNFRFLKNYNNAGRLFNAFDYGHAVLYEKLYTKPNELRVELEQKQFDYLTKNLLIRPPRFAVAEEAVASSYAKLAWRAKMMFDWAHLLHRQIYDVYADERIPMMEKDELIEKLTDYYLTNESRAFPPVPKSMTLMDDQYYSQVFRKGYPKMNGLIWAYHWLQVGLYEPLIVGQDRAGRKAGVEAALARFWSMLEDPPNAFPKVMPMTATVAPNFTKAHPRAAAIFDNLHMVHDIISDILAADTVAADRKREVIYAALDEFQDTTRNVMTEDEWLNMGHMMGGIAAMGGPASGVIPEAPSRNVPANAMDGMGEQGMQHGVPAPDDSARKALAPAPDTSGMAMPGHEGHTAMPDSARGAVTPNDSATPAPRDSTTKPLAPKRTAPLKPKARPPAHDQPHDQPGQPAAPPDSTPHKHSR